MRKTFLPYFVRIFFLFGGPLTAMAEEPPSERASSPEGKAAPPPLRSGGTITRIFAKFSLPSSSTKNSTSLYWREKFG